MRHCLIAVVLGGALAAGGCDAAPRPLSWEVAFTEAGTAADARVLEAEIREGGCSGAAVYTAEVVLEGGPPAMAPPELPPGTYGFAVTAVDASCMRYARGCVEIELPQAMEEALRVELAPIAPVAVCGAAACDDGACARADAGPRPDAGPVDGGGDDAGDAGPPDGGTLVCEEGLANCNLNPLDGCEVALGTLQDCSGCGDRCRFDHATTVCEAGVCALDACDAGWANCDADPSNGCETSLRTLTDCGSCGAACELGHAVEDCDAGRCSLVSCHDGYGDCDAVESNGCETSLRTAASCGACGATCSGLTPLCAVVPAGPRCVSVCPVEAPTSCGDACVDTAADAQHCGACGVECTRANGEGACSAGACALGACDPRWGSCDGSAASGCETSLTTNTDCGACGSACGSSTGVLSCATGSCQVDACFDGLGDCDGSVVNGCEADLSFPSHCGACETPCAAPTPLCGIAGGEPACLGACRAPRPDECEGRCFDLTSDLQNCGSCGLVCAVPSAAPACVEGECRVGECDAGRGDCNANPVDGCETTLDSSPMHCGGCGSACSAPANAEATCAAGTCGFRCAPGFGDCDRMASNGCEQPLDTLSHCGACGRGCSPQNAAGTCVGGSCQVESCNAGFSDCDGSAATGCEVDVGTDRMNCGTCGNRCSGGASRDCCAGVCSTC